MAASILTAEPNNDFSTPANNGCAIGLRQRCMQALQEIPPAEFFRRARKATKDARTTICTS